MKARVSVALSILLALGTISARSATINWINASGGNWSNPANWSPAQVPSATDTAVITMANNYTVTLDVSASVAGVILGASATGTAQTFSTGGQTLTVNGPIQVNIAGQFAVNSGALAGTNVLTGSMNWSGAGFSGATTVAAGSVLNISGASGNTFFYGLALTNHGTVNWVSGTLYGRNGQNAQIYNYGTWDTQEDNTFIGGNEGGTTLFANFGTFEKSGSGGTTSLNSVTFNNNGVVSVESGTLAVQAGTSSGGVMVTTTNGSLDFNNYTFTNGNTFTGVGNNVTGNVIFGGTVAGMLNWTGGYLSGALTVATNSVFNIVQGGGNGFEGLLLTNLGTVNWTNTTIYGRFGLNAQIYNYGLWDCQSDNSFIGGNEGGATRFYNFGSFVKSGNGNGTSLDGSVTFNNTGTIKVESGTLAINAGSSTNGEITTIGSGNLNFNNYGFANSNMFAGAAINVVGSASFGGTMGGTLNWVGGGVSGVLTVAASGVFNILSGGGNGFYGLVLTNLGTINWTNATIYGRDQQNAQIYNYGLWDAQSDNTFVGGNEGGKTLFDNFGTFRKSGNTGVTTLDAGVLFNNFGKVNVKSGTLNLNAGTNSNGNFATATTGIINFANYDFSNNNTFTGPGSYVANGATLAGTLEGTLNWDGGGLSGVLTIASNSVFNIVSGGGNGFYGLILTNYGTVNWTNATIYGRYQQNAQIYNYGIWDAQSDNSFVGGNEGGTTLFENFGTFLKSGNSGTTTLDSGVVFNNSGQVSVQSGSMNIDAGTNSGGSFITASGDYIAFNNYNFGRSNLFTGVGSYVADNAVFGGTIEGTLGWNGGGLSGALTVGSNGVFNIGNGGGNGFYGLVLTNYGTVNWTNATIYGRYQQNARIYNYGVWDAQSDNSFVGGNEGGTTLFDNFGTFLKSGNSGTTTLDGSVVFNNTGKVLSESGTLQLDGGGTNSGSGTFATTHGGALALYNMTFADDAIFKGGSAVQLGGNTTVSGILTANNLELVSGALGGTNLLMGTLTWSGGLLSGEMTVASNSILNIVAGGGNGLYGLVLTNYGTVNWSNTTIYGRNQQNAQIYNYGVWDAQSDDTFEGGYEGGTTLFENFGTFLKSGNTGTTTLDGRVMFSNNGLVESESGTLELNAGTNSSLGTVATTNGGLLGLNNMTLANGSTIDASSLVELGGNTTMNGVVTATNLALVNGILGGTNELKGALIWSGGSLSGDMTIASNGVLNIVAGGGNNLDGLILTNYGTVNWTNTDLYAAFEQTNYIYNYGVWDAQSDDYFQGGYGSGFTLFDNYGAFVKSGGTNASYLDGGVDFNNTGTLDAQSGTLSLSTSANLAGGILNFSINSQTNYGRIAFAGEAVLSGAVGVVFNNGFLPASGSEFQLLTCEGVSGSFSTGALPFGMSFVYAKTSVSLLWNGITQADWAAGASVLHGTISNTFLESPGTTVQLVATAHGVSTVLGATGAGGLGTITFNASQLASGAYSLDAVVLNGQGQVVGDYTRPTFVNNSLAWHEGILSSNQTWGAKAVNAVDQNVIIPGGVTLTIAPGAIVKFAAGTGIIIETGGILDASGATPGEPIIFTSMSDDSVGGDSNEDGNNSVPEPGDWNGIIYSAGYLVNANVQVRYVLQTHSGTISQSQEWSSSQEHYITGNVTLQSGVTLTIAPGAIIKFNPGLNLTVETGATLIALGTEAQPIIFTSINDQSVGTDTSTASGNPAAGDWDSIYFKGGKGTFDHVTISYGGGPDSLNSGLISTTGAGAVVTVLDSTLSQGLYRGIEAEFGNVNVSNCVVTGCDRGIQSGLEGPTVVNVVNCTLDNNNYGVFAHGGVLNLANTIISDSLTAGVAYCCGSVLGVFDHCDVWSANGTYASPIWPIPIQTGLNGNISENPNFVNAAQGNYELNYGSPCIDAANGPLAPLTDLTGAPRYNDPHTLVKSGTPNAAGLYPDIGAYEFVQNASSSIDLIANSVSGPATATAGQSVTVQWNDVNIGTGNAVGPWHDIVSLVPANGGAALVAGSVLVAANTVLGPGQIYQASVNVTVPGGPAGAYQWQVQVNGKGDIFEGVNWTNNTAVASVPVVLEDPSLAIGGTPVTNLFTAAGQSSVSSVISPGQPFLLSLQASTPNCALKLFVGDGYVPSPSHFDYQSSQFNSPAPSLTVPSDNHDTYYVLVYVAALNASSVSYSLTASPVGFALQSVTPASMVNSGPVTLQILGDQLAANDSYALTGPGGVFAATGVQSADPTIAYATFNLAGAAAGLYSLQVTQPAGPAVSLKNAVNVTAAPTVTPAAKLSIQLEIPQDYRVDRPFSGAIVYSDSGPVDGAAPILILTSGGVAGMALQGSSNYQTSDLLLVGASMEGPAGTLTPGQTWSIPFSAVCGTQGSIPFAVNYKTADATDAIDYNSLQATLRPAGYSDSDWNAIWTSFQASAGPTWGGFVRLVDSYSTEMALEDAPGTFYLVSDVLAFAYADLLEKATANAVGTVYLNDTSHPLAGARILLASTNGSASAGSLTASDGTFSIGGLPPGTYVVVAPDYWLPNPIMVTIPDSDYVAGLSIIVNQGGTISGTLANASYGTAPAPGMPAFLAQEAGPFLAGATVEALDASSNSFTATTDQNGNYAFTGLPPGIYEIVELGTATGAPFAVEYVTNKTVGDGSVLVQNFLVQAAGKVVKAQVLVAGTSTPVANAAVGIDVAPNVTVSTTTDSTGAFAFPVNGNGSMVNIAAPGYLPFVGVLGAVSNPSASPPIYLTPASAIKITLDDSANFAISNAVVTVTSNGVVVEIGYTDSNGQTSISNLAAGTYNVQESAYSFQTINTTLTVGAGGATSSTSKMTSLGAIVGRVTDGNGLPIASIDVTVYGNDATNEDVTVTGQTGANGIYIAAGLPPGDYGVAVGNDGGVQPQEVTIISNEVHQVHFVLGGSVIDGTVLGSDGITPVPLATVALSQAVQILATAQTTTNGSYTFRVLIPGTYQLAASAPSGLSTSQTVTVASAANLQAAPLVFGTVTMRIVVTDTGNNSLAGASVALYPSAGGPAVTQLFSASTDSTGTASISGLVAGPYIAIIHQPGLAQLWQAINLSGDLNATYVLNPAVTLTGTITNSSAIPVNQATVKVYDPAAGILVGTATTDASGTYSVPDLYRGTYNVLISQSNYATTEITNVVTKANPFTLDGGLAGKSTLLSGTVTDAGGQPLAIGLVEITNKSGVIFAVLQTSNDGTWSTDTLPPGNYTVTVLAAGYLPPAPAHVVLAAGTPQTLANALPACATDDDSSDGSNGDDGFFDNLSVGIGTLIKNATGSVTPTPISVPGIPIPGDCDEARKAAAAARAALNAKENAYINWEQGNRGTSEALGATGATGLVHSLVAALDTLAQFTPVGASQEFLGVAALPGASQVAIGGSVAATTIAHISTTLVDLKNNLSGLDVHDPTSLSMFLASTAADLTANKLDATTVLNLKAGLVGGPGSPYAVAADAITLLGDLWQGLQDYQAALGVDQGNQYAYQVATANYIRAVVNVENANMDCPPPKGTSPTPPDDTPGPQQPINSVQSGDPNDKTATGVGLAGWVPEGSPITYTIDFQNDTNASAPAQQVAITDPLSSNLDWSTLQLTAISFNNVLINIPAGVQTFSTNAYVSTDPNPVAVRASLDPNTGVLTWLMQSVDPITGGLPSDPLAGFLPPDNAQGQGEGYVIYTVEPKNGLSTGTQITNQASIVFDVNAAIATPTTTNFVDQGAPAITAEPQGVTTNQGGTATFTVSVSSVAPYSYQWSKDGTPLGGQTNAALVLPNVQVGNAGSYSVLISTGMAQTNSAPASLTVTTNPSVNNIEILTSGAGSFTPHDNGQPLVLGHSYTLTATPAPNFLFANWTGSDFTNTPAIKFIMQSNTLLQANFVTNIFLAAHGAYAGLFAPANADRRQTNSGSFNLNVTPSGTLSGGLAIGSQTIPLLGKFDVTGAVVIHSIRHGANPLTTTLRLDLADQSMTGSVSDGTFVAALNGNQAVFSAKNSATAFAGQYTFIIPGVASPAIGPFGDSYGTVKISPLGTVTMAGSLADGTPISQSSVISKDGSWPLYLNLYGGKGSLWGWNVFTNHIVRNALPLSWINQANSSKTADYRSGFTNQAATLTGGLYLPNVTLPGPFTATLEGGNLAFSIMNGVLISAKDKISLTNAVNEPNKLVLTVQQGTGLINGSFANPTKPKQIIKVNGVILQGQTNAQGYFQGANQSGSFTLDPP